MVLQLLMPSQETQTTDLGFKVVLVLLRTTLDPFCGPAWRSGGEGFIAEDNRIFNTTQRTTSSMKYRNEAHYGICNGCSVFVVSVHRSQYKIRYAYQTYESIWGYTVGSLHIYSMNRFWIHVFCVMFFSVGVLTGKSAVNSTNHTQKPYNSFIRHYKTICLCRLT